MEGAIVLGVLGVILVLALAVWLEWIIGKAIGKALSKGVGLVLGIVLILLGFSIVTGIAILVYSNKNSSDAAVSLPAANININTTTNDKPNYSWESQTNAQPNMTGNDTRECPFCAETIKKKATVCRFCGREVSPIV